MIYLGILWFRLLQLWALHRIGKPLLPVPKGAGCHQGTQRVSLKFRLQLPLSPFKASHVQGPANKRGIIILSKQLTLNTMRRKPSDAVETRKNVWAWYLMGAPPGTLRPHEWKHTRSLGGRSTNISYGARFFRKTTDQDQSG